MIGLIMENALHMSAQGVASTVLGFMIVGAASKVTEKFKPTSPPIANSPLPPTPLRNPNAFFSVRNSSTHPSTLINQTLLGNKMQYKSFRQPETPLNSSP